MSHGSRFVLGALLVLTPLASAGHLILTPSDLGTLGGTESLATGLCGTRVVGYSTLAGDLVSHAFITSGTKPVVLVDLGTLPGGTNSFAYGANCLVDADADFDECFAQVVGQSETTDPILGVILHAFENKGGTMLDLGTLGGSTSLATGINREGTVAGFATTTGDFATHAVTWNSAHQITDLGTLSPSGTTSAAYGINDLGEVVGTSDVDTANGLSHAFSYNPKTKTMTDLGTLGGTNATAYAVNNFGAVVGTSFVTGDTAAHAFLYFRGKLTDLGTLGGSYAQATSINDLGVVVGFSNTTGDADVHAFYWTPLTGMVDMNTLLAAGSPWVLNSATEISDTLKVVGGGSINGESHAFSAQVSVDD